MSTFATDQQIRLPSGTPVVRHPHVGPLHQNPGPQRGIYQTSTMAALLDGVYDGDVTFAEIAKHGDFGLGTFNQLDGEMVAVEGQFYRLRADGTATPVDPQETTPFAQVTFFSTDTTHRLDGPVQRAGLEAFIDTLTASKNLFYAIRVDGRFQEVHTRTVAKVEQPYPAFVEATRHQATTTFTNVHGTLIGFRTPDYAQGLGVAGYHLHFLTEDRTGGGHVIDFTLDKATIHISAQVDVHLNLPQTPAFMSADLTGRDLDAEIELTEGGAVPAA
jgi:acetolactate decarboxylase